VAPAGRQSPAAHAALYLLTARRPGIAYRTDGITCDCEAAMLGGDPVCLHRAAYWFAQGMLELDPEPAAPAPAPVVCFRCRGAGVASLAAQAATLVAATEEAPAPAIAAQGTFTNRRLLRASGLSKRGLEPSGRESRRLGHGPTSALACPTTCRG
jgi:hypothetical protein